MINLLSVALSHVDMCVAPSREEVLNQLILEESGQELSHGQTSWISKGIKIQELQ